MRASIWTRRWATSRSLTDKLVKGIMENIPYSHYTGDPVNRLPGTAFVRI